MGRARFEAQLAAEGLAALLHDGKPIMAAAVLLRIKADAIVLDGDAHLAVGLAAQAHPGPLRLRMANHVGERLADDLQDVDFLVGAQRHVLQAVVQFDRHLAALAELGHGVPQRGFQARLVEAEAEGGEQFAQLPVGAVEAFAQFVEGVLDLLRRRLALEQGAQAADLDLQVGQRLCQRIVQFAGDGAALGEQGQAAFLFLLQGQGEGAGQGRPRIDSAIDAAEVVLALAPETNGQVAVKAWEALSKITGREHAHLALPKEDEKIRFRDIQVQPRKIISSPTWSGLEDEHVSYNAGYTNVHELIPWRTITGRQQFYQDHPWMQAFGEGFVSYRPPVNTRTTEKLLNRKPNGNPEITLNWITPHQKWGIHSTYSDNLLMLTLSRGGPIIWLSEHDAAKAGIVDNDWVEVFNANGAATCRAVVSQRVKDGMVMMYHAQERIVNVPGSETTGTRGGHHNSVTRVVLKPTHMIGGYAQQAWGFNYYGTVGCNRDEFVVVRKMSKVDWLDEPRHGGLGGDALPQPLPQDI